MKRFFVLILTLVLAAALASCEGIGDGAFMGTSLKIECRITACDTRGSDVLDEITLTGSEAEVLLEYFTRSEYYETVDSIMFPRSFTVSFYIYDENGECVPMYDSDGVLNEFFVQDTDMVYSNSLNLGNLPGAYEKLFGYIIEKGSTGGYFCYIRNSQTWHINTRISGEPVRNMYQMLTDGTYQTDNDRTAMEKEYIVLGFWGAANGEFYIYSDDYVEEFDSQSTTSLYQPKGTLTGIYQKALDAYYETLEPLTEDEVGYKLNSLSLLGNGKQVPTLENFADIGCISVEEIYTSESSSGEIAYHLILYFESCTIEQLHEKISVLKMRDGIIDAGKIRLTDYGNPSYD